MYMCVRLFASISKQVSDFFLGAVDSPAGGVGVVVVIVCMVCGTLS